MEEYRKFVQEWLKRAERPAQPIDDADRFISLWIAFNGWLREKYGEDAPDGVLINQAINNQDLKDIFNELSDSDADFKNNLAKLARYDVINMRNPNNRDNYRNYNATLESFIRVIYQIRCNLFHGRKSFDEDKKDYELIVLALRLLGPLFKRYCISKGLV